jgi:heme exporter protein B
VLRKYGSIVCKDLLIELRSKDTWVTMAAFALMVVFLFAFAVDPYRFRVGPVFPGILWLSFLFAGMLAVGRGFEHEVQSDAMVGLVMAPGDRLAIFAAKLTTGFVFMVGMEAVMTPVFFALFNQPWPDDWPLLGLLLALGALGFVGVGTLFGAIAANTRAGNVLLPVLLVPFGVPVLILAVEATAAVLHAGSGSPWPWVHALMAYDLLFLGLPLILYEYVWEV